jgi:hypothetical protein
MDKITDEATPDATRDTTDPHGVSKAKLEERFILAINDLDQHFDED